MRGRKSCRTLTTHPFFPENQPCSESQSSLEAPDRGAWANPSRSGFTNLPRSAPDAEFELVDIREFNYCLYSTSPQMPPSLGQYSKEQHQDLGKAKIDPLDGFVFVTPEYNHGICGSL